MIERRGLRLAPFVCQAGVMVGQIIQVSISKGGVPKLAIPEAWAGPLGLEGDVQRNLKYHGGPRKAILLISLEDLEGLQADGFAVSPGALGENLTVQGIDFRQLREGQRFRAGDAVLELTQLRQPCKTLEVYNNGEPGKIQRAVYQKDGTPGSAKWARCGFYASVVQPGRIHTGAIIALVDQIV